MATIYDIAKELNITPSTVSRALNGNSRISEKTRKAVVAVAERLGYHPNSIAAALRSGRTYILGVIVPTTDRSFFASVIRGIESVASTAGYNVMITQSNDASQTEASNIDALLKTQVDGIVASIAKETKNYDHFKKIKARGVPLVLFDRVTEDLGASTIVIDDYLGAYHATEHLIQQGYRRIAHFAGQQHLNIYSYRLRGYRDALERHGLPYCPELVVESNLQLSDGRTGMARLLELPERPDAVFAASDYAAIGAMQTIKQHGLRIPEEVALVGFANEPFTAFVEPGLSSIDQHSEEMGTLAARTILEEIQLGQTRTISHKTVLTPRLIVRESSNRQG